jgi:hypothetical protein
MVLSTEEHPHNITNQFVRAVVRSAAPHQTARTEPLPNSNGLFLVLALVQRVSPRLQPHCTFGSKQKVNSGSQGNGLELSGLDLELSS